MPHKELIVSRLGVVIVLLFLFIGQPCLSQSFRWSNTISDVGTFSSPRFSDFNADGVLDVIIGAGKENDNSPFGVMAFDGLTGDTLWTAKASNQIFGTAHLMDITNDGISDVIIGGRSAHFKAYDGSSGLELWSFSPVLAGFPDSLFKYNFYTPQPVGDLDGDGVSELVNTYGGGRLGVRDPGYVILFNGVDGMVMAVDTVPDNKETFCSPLVHDFDEDGSVEILFGTGGEQYGGSLWKLDLSDLLNERVERAKAIYTDTIKGFIAVPSLADINQDGRLDIIAPGMNQHVAVIDGYTDNLMWGSYSVNSEAYTSPTIGKFVGDARPDIFATFGWGKFPNYNNFIQTVVDGQNGILVWFERDCQYQFGSPLSLDWDNDGVDEVIVLLNRNRGTQAAPQFEFAVRLYDFNDQSSIDITTWRPGIQTFSSPALVDLNGDGSLELVYAYSKVDDRWYHDDEFTIECIDLNKSAQVAWGGYLGNQGDGKYYPRGVTSSLRLNQIGSELHIIGDELVFEKRFNELKLFDAQGRIVLEARNTRLVNIASLAAGIYFYTLHASEEMISGTFFVP